jgi:DNA primase
MINNLQSNGLRNFIDDYLNPAVFDRADTIFPAFNFKRRGGEWHSSIKLDGTESKPLREDKTIIRPKYMNLFEQGTDKGTDFIKYIQDRDNLSFIEAVKSLCDQTGLNMPTAIDFKGYEALKKEQDKREEQNRKYINALQTSLTAEQVREYLKSRGKNWNNPELWRSMGLGYDVNNPDYPLTIPYRIKTRLQGWKYRCIDGRKDKYKNIKGLVKRDIFFNLLTIKGEKDIIIVEGELDALIATALGIPNIVAITGGDLHREQIEDAIRRGAKKFTLCFDSDTDFDKETQDFTKTSKEDTETRIESALKILQEFEEDAPAYVATLPQPDIKEKVDTDIYLNSHTTEEYMQVISSATAGYKYRFYKICEKYSVKKETDKVSEDFISDCIDLMSLLSNPVQQDFIRQQLKTYAGTDKIDEVINKRLKAAQQQAQTRKLQQIITEGQNRILEGQTDEALTLIAERVERLQTGRKISEYEKLLLPASREQIVGAFNSRPESIKTGYCFKAEGEREPEELLLPTGAITFIAAPTSHGKSTMLENLALTAANETPGKKVYYFTLEEEKEAIICNMLNIFINSYLSANNRNTIESYYRNYSDTTERKRFIKTESRALFEAKEEEFFNKYINPGRINVVYAEEYTVRQMIEAIEALRNRTDISAVFIDYIQLMHSGQSYRSRQEEIKDISIKLHTLAVTTRLPLVIAAQFNRSAVSPQTLTPQNLGEAGDLERIASKIIALWKCGSPIGNGDSSALNEAKKEVTP